MGACDRAGHFRAEIVEYGLKAVDKADSKSVAVSFRVLLTAMFENGEWVDWSQYEMDAYGDSWIVKKDGTLNERAVNDLMKHCGWDGQFSSVTNLTWKPTPFQVEIKPHVYNGETTYRVEWINAFDSQPGGGTMGNVDDNKLAELEARFGASLRALGGNVKRNAAPAASRPAPPPPRPTPAMAGSGDGIKF
jgi:hypothetical protein